MLFLLIACTCLVYLSIHAPGLLWILGCLTGLWLVFAGSVAVLCRFVKDTPPMSPEGQAAYTARWLTQHRADKASKGTLSDSEAYDEYLTNIRTQIAAQNQR
jgi:hypothetical protein